MLMFAVWINQNKCISNLASSRHVSAHLHLELQLLQILNGLVKHGRLVSLHPINQRKHEPVNFQHKYNSSTQQPTIQHKRKGLLDFLPDLVGIRYQALQGLHLLVDPAPPPLHTKPTKQTKKQATINTCTAALGEQSEA